MTISPNFHSKRVVHTDDLKKGYTPKQRTVDPKNPPKGGSGVPSKSPVKRS